MKHVFRVAIAAGVGVLAVAALATGYWLGGVFALIAGAALLISSEWFAAEVANRNQD
jgi:hypothetical protein